MIRLHLLGPFKLERDGETIRLPARKQEMLLAFLVLHPESHPREVLATLEWGDSPDEKARASLRNALATLRRRVGDDLLLADTQRIQINPNATVWVDVFELRAQIAAFKSASLPQPDALDLALYRGDMLEGAYDDWLLPERERLREEVLEAGVLQAAALKRLGQIHGALSVLLRMVVIEPAHEPAWQAIMQCHLALEDRPAAMAAFERCKHALNAGLGVDPDSETLAILQRIRQPAPRRNAAHAAGNLPAALTSFVGRAAEIAAVLARFAAGARLITLTGVGGTGKTRLALEAAQRYATSSGTASNWEGAWWIEYAALSSPALVPATAAKSLGLRGDDGDPAAATAALTTRLNLGEALLVVDNCEHLLTPVAQLVNLLLSVCPRLNVLATSREALGLPGEVVVSVPPLPTGATPAQSDAPSEAVRLFVERAQAVRPGLLLTSGNAALIAQICRELDGLPLAIELAAARVRVLSLEGIAARLGDRFALLAGGNRAGLQRHQTLRAAMDWSHDMLTSDEQVMFHALAVFVGGFTMEAAEAVARRLPAAHLSALNVLTSLTDKNLVQTDWQEQPRFLMLETVRQYGLDQLQRCGQERTARECHLAWCVQLAEEGARALNGPRQAEWLERLETEHANLRAALGWAETNSAALGVKLAVALWRFWGLRGHLHEGRAHVNALLGQLQTTANVASETLSSALATTGVIAARQGDHETARAVLTESVRQYRQLDDSRGEAFALHHLGWLHTAMGETTAARACHQRALALRRGLGPEGRRDLAETLTYLGLLAWIEGDLAGARACEEEALMLKHDAEPWGIQFSRWIIANIDFAEGKVDVADAAYRAILAVLRDQRDRWGTPNVLESLANVAIARGQWRRGLLLVAAAHAIRKATYSPLPPIWEPAQKRAIDTARVGLGAGAADTAWHLGMQMSLEDAQDFALSA